jgi:hypothetical protein
MMIQQQRHNASIAKTFTNVMSEFGFSHGLYRGFLPAVVSRSSVFARCLFAISVF